MFNNGRTIIIDQNYRKVSQIRNFITNNRNNRNNRNNKPAIDKNAESNSLIQYASNNEISIPGTNYTLKIAASGDLETVILLNGSSKNDLQIISYIDATGNNISPVGVTSTYSRNNDTFSITIPSFDTTATLYAKLYSYYNNFIYVNTLGYTPLKISIK